MIIWNGVSTTCCDIYPYPSVGLQRTVSCRRVFLRTLDTLGLSPSLSTGLSGPVLANTGSQKGSVGCLAKYTLLHKMWTVTSRFKLSFESLLLKLRGAIGGEVEGLFDCPPWAFADFCLSSVVGLAFLSWKTGNRKGAASCRLKVRPKEEEGLQKHSI